jgi:uncharacterized iron-regulated membrane protein
MDEIHGDHQRQPPSLLRADYGLVSPQIAIDSLKATYPMMAVSSLQLVNVLGFAGYQIVFYENAAVKTSKQVRLADALTGKLRSPLSKEEAVSVAQNAFHGEAEVEKVKYLTTVNNDHEYRESPLPAYAIRFKHPSKTTVYVAAKLGTVQKLRNEKWRIFDFLWMLHTMDYSSRDNFGNLLLKIFSVMGMITIISGFALYYLSSPTIRKWKKSLVYRATKHMHE